MLRERYDESGRLVHATLFLRPLASLRPAIAQLHRAPAPPTFRALRQSCGDISSSVLSRRLAELTEDRLVRHDGTGYALTATGRRLVTSLQLLLEWSHEWADGLPPGPAS